MWLHSVACRKRARSASLDRARQQREHGASNRLTSSPSVEAIEAAALMDRELWAQLVLSLYGVAAVLVVAWQVAQCRDGWRVWVLYVIERLYCGLLFRWRGNRPCPFPAEGPALVIANHSSPVDPLLIWMNHHLDNRERRIRVISFLMAREYYELRALRFISEGMQSIPTERDGKDMGPAREALRRLKKGKLIGIFPEGHINRSGGLLEANSGVAWLALHAKVPVYPVFIHGSPGGKTMIEPFYTPCRVRVAYGDPVDLSSYYGRRRTHELLREVTEFLMSRLAELEEISKIASESAEQSVDLRLHTG